MSNTADDRSTSSAERFTLDRVLSVFRDRRDQARPLTANDVMEALDCSRRTAHDKLDALVERGVLETRKVGARSRIWWVPLPRRSGRGDGWDRPRDPLVEMHIADAELPGPDERLQERRDALRAAYDYLRDNPDADLGEFLSEVFPDHPAGYKTADEWWEAIGPALEGLPNVDIASDRDHLWFHIGG
jgi:hypothetical protein